jgi:hypothetical protein
VSRETHGPFVPGVNYPWTRFQGKNNYGCDFGRNVWGGHGGVSRNREQVGIDFAAMAAAGARVARWFVFTDGRGGVRWTADGTLEGHAEHFFDDMDAALEIAAAHGVQLCLVLFDHLWMFTSEARDGAGALVFRTHPELFMSAGGRDAVFERLIDPLMTRYGTGGVRADLGAWIHSFDVMNEPDWATAELEPSRDPKKLARPMTLADLRELVRGVADRVHERTRSLVTVGGGRARFASEWDNEAYGLDYLQVHLYLDTRRLASDLDLRTTPCAALRLAKPLVIGEFPANGHFRHPEASAPPTCSMEEYLDYARRGGYLGAWPWSFNGIDEFGAVSRAAFAAWVAGHGPTA